MDVLILSREEVRELLDLDALLSALEKGFAALSEGRVVSPDRGEVAIPGAGHLLLKSAWMPGGAITVKLVTTFLGNASSGFPCIQALVSLFDAATGAPLAVMDGATLTAARTAASSALSARYLAGEDARVLAILGAGVQGHAHLAALTRVRDFGEIRIASLYPEEARTLAAADRRCRPCGSNEEAVRGADVVCLCTSSAVPVIEAGWVAPGAHVTSVGYHPPRGELPPGLIRGGNLVVESRLAFGAPPVGCGELAGLDPELGVELGELVLGRAAVRRSPDGITVYKSMGHAVEDLVAADLVYRRAKEEGAGQVVRI